MRSIRISKDGFFCHSEPVAQLVRATGEGSTQRDKNKEVTNITSSVTPIIKAPPPELQEIINRWDNLPEHIRQTIQMLVETAGENAVSLNDLGEV